MRIRHIVSGLVAVATASLIACNDNAFLTESPQNFVSPTQFYHTSADAVAAINSVYAAFINGTGDNYYGRNFFMLVEYPTETLSSGRLSGTNERSLPDNFSYTPVHSYIESVWTSAYNAINRANAVIDRVPAITMDTTLRKRIVAEAKFLRALHYFNLVRLFGDVPLHTAATNDFESLDIAKSTAAQIYTQIVTDLRDAMTALPHKSSYTGSDIGRATLGAARTLLAKVYIQRAATVNPAGAAIGAAVDYDSAQTLLTAVINEPAPNNYTLVANTMLLWDYYGGTVIKNNTEMIFEVQNTRASGLGGRLSSHMAPNATAPYLGAATNGSVAAELNFYNSYLAADTRKASTWIISWNTPTAVNAWQPPPASNTSAGNVAYGSQTPFPRKMLDRLMPSVGAEEPNFPVLRYADVLLMMAEAINERTGPATALTYINQVRTRSSVPNVPGAVTQAQLRDSISLERRWELVAEGHGHFDSQRNWTWAKARIEANLVLGRGPTNNALPNPTGGNRYPRSNVAGVPCTGTALASVCTLTMKYYYYPIPQRALDLSKKLVQNPNWP